MIDRAVVNAGPLVALSLIGQLDLLPILFAECWVPQTVFNEVAVSGIGKPGAASLQTPEWLGRMRLIPFPFQSESRRTDEDSALARLGGATTYTIEMEME